MRRERASAVCVHEGQLLCVMMRDPVTAVARLFAPGGAIEPGETPAAAAERETVEETGYVVRVDPESELVARYPFVWAGVEIDCTTHFFRARLLTDPGAPAPTSDTFWNEGTVWLPLSELDEALRFHAAIHVAVRALCRKV